MAAEATVKDYYALLGVSPTAEERAIRAAWRALVFATHPDRNPGDPVAAARCAQANEAWSVLSDPMERARYDATRRDGRVTWAEPPPPPPRWWTSPPSSVALARPVLRPEPRRRAPEPGYWDEQGWLEEQFGRWAYWTRQGTPRDAAWSGGYRRRPRRP